MILLESVKEPRNEKNILCQLSFQSDSCCCLPFDIIQSDARNIWYGTTSTKTEGFSKIKLKNIGRFLNNGDRYNVVTYCGYR